MSPKKIYPNKAKNSKSVDAILERMVSERNFRIALARESHYWFFHLYFHHYVSYRTADFHREIFRITEDEKDGIAIIVAFRGSAKSTVCTLSYPLWAILGKQKKKFVVILSKTQRQSRQHLSNIKKELEQNPLLRSDLGPFKEETDEWGGYSLVIPRYGARITAASSEQTIRGMRHLQFRPDVIIADDIEDLQSVRTQDGRNKAYEWFKGDIVPSGAIDTKIIVVGNLLHEDSLLMRLKDEIETGTLHGIYREFPIMSEGKNLWDGRFPTEESIEAEHAKISDESAWQREYLLKIIAEEDQVVKRGWIQYYDDFPLFESDKFSWTKIAVDLAISEKQTADYTAMVAGSLFGRYGNAKLYIHSHSVNARMDFPTAIDKAKELAKTANPGHKSQLLIEEVAYQAAFTQQLKRDWFDAKGVKIGNIDKRSRLSLVSHLIKNGMILFPKKGCEELISQLVHLGVEKHDDLADAFVILATHALESTRIRARAITDKPFRL